MTTTVTTTATALREFRMPDVGEGLTEAEITTWYVAPGDTVTDGQLVCEIETAKAAVELPIPFDGVVREIRFPVGTTVDVGAVIIVVGAAGGAEPEPPEPGPEGERRQPVLVGYGVSTSAPRRRRPAAIPVVSAPVAPEPAAPEPVAPPPGFGSARALAKPPVRKLAKDLGVDLAGVRPTGPDGVLTREDVQAALTPARPAQPRAEVAAEIVGGDRRVPIKGVRRATAAAMVASAFTAPHVTEFVTFDITRTMKLVGELRQDPAFAGLRVGPLLLVMKALLVAVRRNPEVNAAWDEARQEIVYKEQVNLGIAAATPRGLMVPNIKDAGRRTLPELAAALGELVATAREGRTSPAQMQGGSLTITNIGVFGVDTGTPILNPGESVILAFGAVKDQPWVHHGSVVPRKVTTLSLSFDHRVVDGELGSRFLADIAAILERPKRLITWA